MIQSLQKIILVLFSCLIYMLGVLGWVGLLFVMFSQDISFIELDSRAKMVFLVLCFVVYPLSLYLFSRLASGYEVKRLSLILMLPIPAFVVGALMTPHNLAPTYLLLATLMVLVIMNVLLNFWAKHTNET